MAVSTKYDLGRFDLVSDSLDIDVQELCAESLGGTVNITAQAVELVIEDYFPATLTGTVTGCIAVMVTGSVSGSLDGSALARADMLITLNAVEGMAGGAETSCNLEISHDLPSSMDGWAEICVILAAFMFGHGDASGAAEIGVNIPAAAFVAESAMGRADASSVQTQTIVLTLTIPAHGELRIDTGIFTATLGGVNVIWAQSGDWPTMGPGTVSVDVATGSGGALAGTVGYTQRYL